MAKGFGTIDGTELKRRAETGEVDTVLAVFPDVYGRLMGKRFDADYFLGHIAEDGTHACNYLLTVDMEMEPVPGYDLANWQKGYGDFHLVPDFRTLRHASWLDRTALVLCDVQSDQDHASPSAPIEQSPRSMLLKQIAAASKVGYEAMAASELEYYLFRNSYRDAAAAEYRQLEPAGWYLEDYHALQGTRAEDYHGLLRRHLKQSDIAVESTKGEWGKGQHEVNVRYRDVLSMADNRERDRRPIGRQRHLHGEALGQTGGFELPRAPEPVAGRAQCIRGSAAFGGHRMFRRLYQIPGGMAGPRPRSDGFLRPQRQFL
jgi:glutamine synthetase